MGFVILILVLGTVFIFLKVMAALNEPAKPNIVYRTKDTPVSDDIHDQFVVIDVETTGLSAFEDEIIEIGALKVNKDSDQHQTFQTLIKPTKKITQKITDINGITNEMVEKDGVALNEALEALKQFIGDLPVVAYNIDFDKEFINIAAERLGMKKIIKRGRCALKIARKAFPGLKSYKLSYLAEVAGYKTQGMHRALADCQMTAVVYMSGAPRVKAIYRGR